jgi:hypothetical protein
VKLLVAVLLVVAATSLTPPATAAECQGPALRTFTEAERWQFETQYGVNWWKAMGLIPGPQTADDYVNRPAGDSIITVYIPQQFWDFRGCATGAQRPAPAGSAAPPERPRQH